ncbi:hypothetical protein ABPG75_001887 [Micractinium tetrahymenae]
MSPKRGRRGGSATAAGAAAAASAPPPTAGEQQASGAGAAARLNDLPDDVMVQIFDRLLSKGGIPPKEARLAHLALVCRRWYQLCHCPQLLRHVLALLPLLRWSRPRPMVPPSLENAHEEWASFRAWMQRHGAKVGSLAMMPSWIEPAPSAGERRRLFCTLWCCLKPCEVAGACLAELEAQLPPGPEALPTHLSRLHSLRGMKLGSIGGELSPLAALTGLQRLELEHLHPTRPVQLPTGLTTLRLCVREGVPLPCVGLAALTALAQLELTAVEEADCALPADVCSALPRLQQLTLLRLSGWDSLPAGLVCSISSLAGLRLLHLSSLCEGIASEQERERTSTELDRTLGTLSQLSSLILCNVHFLDRPPAALAQLQQLQGLQVACANWAPRPTLPAGPWLSRIRRLSCDWELLHASSAALAAAATPALEHLLVVFFFFELRAEPNRGLGLPDFWAWLWRWAKGHPALRCLELDEIDNTEDAGLVGCHRSVTAAMKRLRKQRPDMEATDDASTSCFWSKLGSVRK